METKIKAIVEKLTIDVGTQVAAITGQLGMHVQATLNANGSIEVTIAIPVQQIATCADAAPTRGYPLESIYRPNWN